jgi:hypothetical protein
MGGGGDGREGDDARSHDEHEGQHEAIDGSAVEQSAKAMLDAIGVEVEKEAHPASREAQVGQQLEVVDGLQPLHRLQLHDDQILDQQVETVAGLQSQSPASAVENL